ncbi:MAG: TAT-variant-translocated molybdopterin oxidoreductase, partial [Acidobacteria bacterium]|nr:TAT-variant-translocated molybdopterin oxidoreductase [Acidobacteriota bacterium]
MSETEHNLVKISGVGEKLRLQASNPPLDLAAIQAKLSGTHGQQYWRSLEELAGTPEFMDFLHREFPENASEWMDPVGRRGFLKLMGASLALAGLSGCTRAPVEKIVPYVRQPEEIVPGKPLYFATAMPLSGIATGVLVTSHMGRPTKIEGNPEHPASLGATDAITQASILTLYDPDRSQVLNNAGRISTWSAFLAATEVALAKQRVSKGAGLRILTETVTSPTLAWQLRNLLAEFPAAKWHQWEPCGRHSAREGAKLAFGEYVETRYHFDKADVILSLGSDFLCSGPGHVRYAREFAAKRRVTGPESKMNRLYALESTPTNTGTMADHRVPVRAREIESWAREIGQQLGVSGVDGLSAESWKQHRKWLESVVKDLQAHRGACLVVPGEEQTPAVHALTHGINEWLGNVGTTVTYTDSVEANPADQIQSIRDLVADMNAGKVEFLVILGGNPVYNAPADLNFTAAMSRVPLRAHLGLYDDETSAQCHWHIPETHYLEAWSDCRAFDGTITIQQPLIAPLYEGKSVHEFLTAFTKNPSRPGYDIVREYWKARMGEKDFEKSWRRALHDGFVAGAALPEKKPAVKRLPPAIENAKNANGVEIIFRPDPCVYDGQFANNGWLQELPKPLSKMVWDNAALVSPSLALKLGVQNEQIVELKFEGRTLNAPVWITPGHAEDSVTLHLGYGRTRGGRIAARAGFNAYTLRGSSAPWFSSGLQITKTEHRYPITLTQHHHSIDTTLVSGRVAQIVRTGDLEEFRKKPDFVKELAEEPPDSLTLYPKVEYHGNAWGLAVDLNSCNGCSACVTACQSEN